MKTANGVTIEQGLRVWTNDLERGWVDLEYRDPWFEGEGSRREGWFYVQVHGELRRVIQSESRVSTRHPFTGEKA